MITFDMKYGMDEDLALIAYARFANVVVHKRVRPVGQQKYIFI